MAALRCQRSVALPKLFAERLGALTSNTAWIGSIAAAVYIFGALAQYCIGRLLDRHSLKSVFLALAFLLAPLLTAAAHARDWQLIVVSIGIVVGIFGQVTINDAMVAKYTSDQWRARAYAARHFLGFTAAGASVALVAWLHERGGFSLMLQTFGALCTLVIVGAMIFPTIAAVRYRRAPEHPFPTPLEDCYSALAWLRASAELLSLDPQRVAVGGASAGAGLAAALCQLSCDRAGLAVTFQLLIYPMLDDRSAVRADIDRSKLRVWTQQSNRPPSRRACSTVVCVTSARCSLQYQANPYSTWKAWTGQPSKGGCGVAC